MAGAGWSIDDPPGPIGRGTPDDPRLVVETWLAVPAEDDWRLLMLRRAPNHGGFWQGVSGRVESFDASLRAAALREIREETGLVVVDSLFDLGRWIEFQGFTRTHYRKRSLGAMLPAGTSPQGVTLSDEHDAVELLTFDEARTRLRWAVNAEELAALAQALPPHRGGGER